MFFRIAGALVCNQCLFLLLYFVHLFLGVRRITDLGSRKTKVLVHATDVGDKLTGDACAELLEVAGVEHYSDGDGDLTILGIKRSNYTLVVGKGELRARMRFGIMTGEQLRLKVVLVGSMCCGPCALPTVTDI